MLEVYESEKIRYLTNQISDMYRGRISLSDLGSIALQTIMARREAEEILEGDYPDERKELAKKELKRLKELEKGLVYLYINALSNRLDDNDDPLIKHRFFI